MNHSSTIEDLQAYAKMREIPCVSHQNNNHFTLVQQERFGSTKFLVYDLSQHLPHLHLVFYDSYSSKAYTGNTYCGLFCTHRPARPAVRINKLDWFDRLRLKKRLKSGDAYIDKRTLIVGESTQLNPCLIKRNVIKQYLQLADQISPLELFSENHSMSLVPQLHAQNIIGLKTNRWLLEASRIDLFIERGVQLFQQLQ